MLYFVSKGVFMSVIQETTTPENLHRYLEEALEEMQMRIAAVQKKYSAPFEVIREYLEINEPNLIESMDILEKECDNGILMRCNEGKASSDECTDWLKCVRDWKHLFLEGINRFEDYQIVAHVA